MKARSQSNKNNLLSRTQHLLLGFMFCGFMAACAGGEGTENNRVLEAETTEAATTSPELDAVTTARLETRSSDKLGTYVTDADGRSLYMFKADSPMESTCYDACAQAWPPYTVQQGKPEAGQGIDASKIGTIQRRDGSTQVTYNGWPLYYYVKDQGTGQTTGQDVKGFGAEWYLLTPEGEMLHAEGHH